MGVKDATHITELKTYLSCHIFPSSAILKECSDQSRIFKYPGLFQKMLEYGIQAKEREWRILRAHMVHKC